MACPATTLDGISKEPVRCTLPAGHSGSHEGGCITWLHQPSPYSSPTLRRCPECDQYRYLGPGASCPDCPPSRERLLEETARAYLQARDRVDPEGEREARARLEEVLRDR
jgi:hypothetical protein